MYVCNSNTFNTVNNRYNSINFNSNNVNIFSGMYQNVRGIRTKLNLLRVNILV
jgi:hypothetical protein